MRFGLNVVEGSPSLRLTAFLSVRGLKKARGHLGSRD